MGVNPVPDNILSRRGGSRTARPPLVVLAHAGTHPSLRFSRAEPAPKTRGRESIPTTHISCRAEPRNLAALPLVVLADAGTHPSFPRCHYYENLPFRGYKSLPP